MIGYLFTHYNYIAAFLLVAAGLYLVVSDRNFVKKIIGMNIFQTGIFLFFITTAYVEFDGEAGAPPVVPGGAELAQPPEYVSPLPHVLILTAIVVGVSLTAVALTLVIRIYSEYGTLREDILQEIDTNE